MIDWDALGRETIDLLRRYLMLDTTNPPGNETVGARFLEEALARDDIARALARRAPGVVVAPDILVGFTDNWVFRNCGLHGYGFSPFVLGDDDWRRVHGNDERISLENLLLDVAAA